jgi:hypothetical protein
MKRRVFLSDAMLSFSLSLTHFQTEVPETMQNSDRTLAVLLKLEV